jgi:hypothetical protein
VPEEQADRACSLLEQGNSVDFQAREQQWRSEGWSGDRERQQTFAGGDSSSERGKIVEEERTPIVEEQLRVGKREEQRGGARVRSYVEERPVSEQVNLREEHVNVERRPVDQPISSGDDKGFFQDRTIEMHDQGDNHLRLDHPLERVRSCFPNCHQCRSFRLSEGHWLRFWTAPSQCRGEK